MTHHRPTLLAIVVLTALLAACAGSAPAATSPEPTAGDHGTHDGGEGDHADQGAHADHGAHEDASHVPSEDVAHEVTITATEFAYSPAQVRVPAGKPVRIRLRNDGAVVHDLDLEEAGLHLHTAPGDNATAVVTFDEPGRYVAECTEPGHTASGMRLVVQAH